MDKKGDTCVSVVLCFIPPGKNGGVSEELRHAATVVIRPFLFFVPVASADAGAGMLARVTEYASLSVLAPIFNTMPCSENLLLLLLKSTKEEIMRL